MARARFARRPRPEACGGKRARDERWSSTDSPRRPRSSPPSFHAVDRSRSRVHTRWPMSGLRVIGGDMERALEQVNVPSYVVDPTGIIRWLNPAAQRLVGDA